MELVVTSNNHAVVPNDGFGERSTRSDGLRCLNLLGKSCGTTLVQAGTGGAVWCTLQVQVGELDSTSNPAPPAPFHFDIPFTTGPTSATDFPMYGQVPMALGVSTVIRIPVPGTRNLAIEFFARNYKGNSTSTVFIQDLSGKIHLRLDHGYNVATKTVDYHWNLGSKQTGGMKAEFGRFPPVTQRQATTLYLASPSVKAAPSKVALRL